MNISNCNLCYPKLHVTPSYGDAMKYHAECCFNDSNGEGGGVLLGINHYGGDEFKAYLSTGEMKVGVDWGPAEEPLIIEDDGSRSDSEAGCDNNCPSSPSPLTKYIESVVAQNCTGDGGNDNDDKTQQQNLQVQLTVHGIGRRPGMKLFASNQKDIRISKTKESNSAKGRRFNIQFPRMDVTWKHHSASNTSQDEEVKSYPEYLVSLKVFLLTHGNDNDDDDTRRRRIRMILKRTLHAVPPPIGQLKFDLPDVIWAPGLFQKDAEHSRKVINACLDHHLSANNESKEASPIEGPNRRRRRRRGFGLELETVQLPPDYENSGCFTHQEEFQNAIEKVRKWHLSQISSSDNKDDPKVKAINEMWDQFSLWGMSNDIYVENSAPPTRVDLYQRVVKHLDCKEEATSNGDATTACPVEDAARRDLENLILGGRVAIPPELLTSIPYDSDDIPTSQASPEYKSPPPPNELYHVFPPPEDGIDESTMSIRLFLDGILKNPVASSRPVLVPTVSDIGQSASSIHVHVNVRNENAWPRRRRTKGATPWSTDNPEKFMTEDLEDTHSLLCVVFAWIVFDRVVQNYFCMPNVWRDKSLAPMYVTGPEFIGREYSWQHGTSVSIPDENAELADINVHNVPAWYRHVHSSLRPTTRKDDDEYCPSDSNKDEEKKDSSPTTSIFGTVFDHEVISNTMFRWNSLNLLSLQKYGTIEFRRMHASLNGDFVSSWTWFCVGFVEKFSHPSMFEKFLHPFLLEDDVENGLEKLVTAQSGATIEDLHEAMHDDSSDPLLPKHVFAALLSHNHLS